MQHSIEINKDYLCHNDSLLGKSAVPEEEIIVTVYTLVGLSQPCFHTRGLITSDIFFNMDSQICAVRNTLYMEIYSA